ncbi:MAG: GntR family transcriptional regulator [Hyphomicrobiaceae bacterium]
MSGAPAGIRKPFATKSEWLYDELKKRITGGTLKPGERLRLTEIAREFGTSEMPVREALRMLDRDRLVTIESHRGAVVSGLTMERAVEIIAVRTHLEVLALEEAMLRHTPESLAALKAMVDEMAASEDPERFSKLNREFHTALYLPGPNATLKAEIEALWDRLWQTRDVSIFAMDARRIEGARREHAGILARLQAGEAREALELMIVHRRATLKAWHEAMARAASTMTDH